MSTRALPQLLTTAQVAQILGEHVETTAQRIRRGQIPAVRMTNAATGRTARNAPIRVRDVDVMAYLDGLKPANRTAGRAS